MCTKCLIRVSLSRYIMIGETKSVSTKTTKTKGPPPKVRVLEPGEISLVISCFNCVWRVMSRLVIRSELIKLLDCNHSCVDEGSVSADYF
jgi:hypothetical protein